MWFKRKYFSVEGIYLVVLVTKWICRALWGYNVEPNIFFWKFGPFCMIISKIQIKWGMTSKSFKQKLVCRRALFSCNRHKMYFNIMCRTLQGYNIEPNILFWKFGPFWTIISKIHINWSIASKIFQQILFCRRVLISCDRRKMNFYPICRSLWGYNI